MGKLGDKYTSMSLDVIEVNENNVKKEKAMAALDNQESIKNFLLGIVSIHSVPRNYDLVLYPSGKCKWCIDILINLDYNFSAFIE
jgi:hypothetical protein